MANEFVIKNGYLSKGNSQLTGSLDVSGSVSASLGANTVGFYGTASWAQSASWAPGATPTNPGGSNTQIQFNSASVFNGSSNLSFDYTNNNLLVTGSIRLSGSQYFSTSASAGVDIIGQIGWNKDDATLDLGLSGSAGNIPILKIGEQQIARVYNAQGTAITKGQVVYISGSQGNRIAIKLASATAELGSANTLGFVLDDIGSGTEGYILTEGPLYKLNTNTLTAGLPVYLSTTPGAYTQTAPDAPNHRVILGFVERVSATVGSIYVKVDNGYELNELHNVLISSPSSSGDLLVLSGSVWINSKQLTGSYGLTGSLNITGSLVLSGSLTTNDGIYVQTITASIVSASSGITGSLFGTASYVTGSIFTSTNPALSASYALTSSYSISSSYTLSSSYAFTASYIDGGFY